jgi:hypothetical protein
MSRRRNACLITAIVAIVCGVSSVSTAEDQLTGLILGRTGELLNIRLDQPVREGTVFSVKSILSEPPIAEAKVESCTKEWPFVALAKVVQTDYRTSIPLGAKAFAGVSSVDGSVEGKDAPGQIRQPRPGDDDRFSVQVGTFYPSKPVLRDTVADFWQAYRLNYSFAKVGNFETALSAEYSKGKGSFQTTTGAITRTTEVIPLTMMAKFKPARFGSTSLVVGAGAGVYRIRSREETGSGSISDTIDKFGREYAIGLESSHKWVVELRYRDVPDTDIQGYLLALGSRY